MLKFFPDGRLIERMMLLSTVLCASLASSCAQETPTNLQATTAPVVAAIDAPLGGQSLLPAATLEAFKVGGPKAVDAQVSIVAVEHPAFKQALRVRTVKQPPRPFDIQLAARNAQPIAKGDILHASFWMRTIESPMQEGFVGFTFEQASPEFKRSFGYETSAGTVWKRFDFPFKSVDNYAPGEAAMNLRLGYAPQIIEIGGVELRNFANSVDINSLPATKLTYVGSEPDAAWRKAAQERIEKIRKADLQIRVQDANGRPVPNAQVTIKQTRSAFPFGSAVSAKALISDTPADRKYQEMVKTHFNRIVFENDLKWNWWKNDRESPVKALKWLRDAGIEARGHVLVWPSWRHSPPHLKELANDPAALKKAVEDHIADAAGTLRGQLHDWDVLNEPYKNHDIIDLLGPSIQTEWFQAAHRADPNAKLYLNDYGILSAGGKDSAHQKHYEDTIAFLIKEKAPIHGIGMQGHFGSDLTPPTRMLEILDRYAKFGLPIQITEFDVQVSNETLQADFTRDFLTTMFSHPAVNGVVMWGFWEGRHYAPGAALWRKDWSIKPNGQAWSDLVLRQWRTNIEATSNAVGTFQTRGFLGDYEIVVKSGDKTKTVPTTLTREGKFVTIKLP
jgi:GH35 family endo-1,4-beta-xylanase